MTNNSIKPISQRIREAHERIISLEVKLSQGDYAGIFRQMDERELKQAEKEFAYLLTIVKECLS